jgi:hypothetical protein
MPKERNPIYSIYLENTNINMKKAINHLNKIIDDNKGKYDKLYESHLKNIYDHNNLIDSFEMSKSLHFKQKEEIKRICKALEKKNMLIKDHIKHINKLQFKIKNQKPKVEILEQIKDFEVKKQNNEFYTYEERINRNKLVHETLLTI